MAKRGVRRPWRVAYEWSTGAKGVETYSDEETAERKADEIRAAGERWAPNRSVVVTVSNRDVGE